MRWGSRVAVWVLVVLVAGALGGGAAWAVKPGPKDPCDERYRESIQGLRNYLDCRLDRLEAALKEAHPAPPPPGPGPVPPPPGGGEATATGFITAYTWWDNTPPGSADIAYEDAVPGRTGAGGTGTFEDPVTVAVPQGSPYTPGEKLYLPHLSRYGVVEDLCGEGCTAYVDVWIDGRDLPENEATQCAYNVTGDHPVVRYPAPGKPVTTGRIC